jgi:hypothetical protein
VGVTNTGTIETYGAGSRGIFAQSVGGFAGRSGGAGGLFAFGASGQSGGSGGEVTVTNSGAILTLGAYADAIYAQSVGGGGGSGGMAGGAITIGGAGGEGGQGGVVKVDSDSMITTYGSDAHGISAQSVGGGGGSGGFAITGTAGTGWTGSLSLGGSGGEGGSGQSVTVNSTADITTSGFHAYGILA